jgi:hypothetical protein
MIFLPGLASNYDPTTYASHVEGITDVNHHAWLVFWDRISLTLLPELALVHNPPVSSSQVAGITGMSTLTKDWPLTKMREGWCLLIGLHFHNQGRGYRAFPKFCLWSMQEKTGVVSPESLHNGHTQRKESVRGYLDQPLHWHKTSRNALYNRKNFFKSHQRSKKK